MNQRLVIKKETVKSTVITLWKNVAKDPRNTNYSITISNPQFTFISVSSIHKKDLTYMTLKYHSIAGLIKFLAEEES